jgi:hypothetical protein
MSIRLPEQDSNLRPAVPPSEGGLSETSNSTPANCQILTESPCAAVRGKGGRKSSLLRRVRWCARKAAEVAMAWQRRTVPSDPRDRLSRWALIALAGGQGVRV